MYPPILFDLHTHSISSGHGSQDTILAMARAAKNCGLMALGISDHGPATPNSAKASYFRSLTVSPRHYLGVHMLHGVELNILNSNGDIDLSDEILSKLDYAFIGFHRPTCPPMSEKEHTAAYLNAMNHPKVRFISHMDDGRYSADYKQILITAKEKGIFPEINNISLSPDSYRLDGFKNSKKILQICKSLQLPVILSSDSHGIANIGNVTYIYPLLEKVDFPQHLILNFQADFLKTLILTRNTTF